MTSIHLPITYYLYQNIPEITNILCSTDFNNVTILINNTLSCFFRTYDCKVMDAGVSLSFPIYTILYPIWIKPIFMHFYKLFWKSGQVNHDIQEHNSEYIFLRHDKFLTVQRLQHHSSAFRLHTTFTSTSHIVLILTFKRNIKTCTLTVWSFPKLLVWCKTLRWAP